MITNKNYVGNNLTFSNPIQGNILPVNHTFKCKITLCKLLFSHSLLAHLSTKVQQLLTKLLLLNYQAKFNETSQEASLNDPLPKYKCYNWSPRTTTQWPTFLLSTTRHLDWSSTTTKWLTLCCAFKKISSETTCTSQIKWTLQEAILHDPVLL